MGAGSQCGLCLEEISMIEHIYGAEVETIHGQVMSLEKYRGKVILVVNTATGCGFNGQLEGLEALYKRFEKLGFVVLGIVIFNVEAVAAHISNFSKSLASPVQNRSATPFARIARHL